MVQAAAGPHDPGWVISHVDIHGGSRWKKAIVPPRPRPKGRGRTGEPGLSRFEIRPGARNIRVNGPVAARAVRDFDMSASDTRQRASVA